MLKPSLRKIKVLISATAVSAIFMSCKSTDDSAEKLSLKQSSEFSNPTASDKSVPKQVELKDEIASLRAEVQSLSERLKTSERNIETLQRGVRSGIWESPQQTQSSVDVPVTESQVASPAPTALENTEGSALKRIATAEMKMTAGEYVESCSTIKNIEQDFPNLNDGGKTYLLLAECSLQLQKPDASLSAVRKFYLKYPKSPEILAAKLIEARSHASMGSKERAIGVYREVISLAPRSSFAQTARAALQKLRDEK